VAGLPTSLQYGRSGVRTAPSAEPAYSRRQLEKTALYRVSQQHLLTFEQEWTDKFDGRRLSTFVTEELS
jgi:hypothetical protein